ncbi:DUF106 domain-containing protein [Candidatus Woesearchaeota archaeon]|nr:DUF106 domain-containing protein [Candidatus Woesearchaeota archaeon]
MTFFDTALDPILRPLLTLGPLLTILIISLIVSLITTFIYKYATDQTKLRKLKADMKRYQKKAMASKDDPEKAMKMQKEMMKLNGEYMRSSMKSMLYTFLPILLFFGWLGANLAFAPIVPGVPFNVSATFESGVSGSVDLVLPVGLTMSDNLTKPVQEVVSWNNISGPAGTYDLSVIHSSGEEQFFSVLITDKQKYVSPEHLLESDIFKSVNVGNKKLYLFRSIPVFNKIPLIKNFNWFWTYFLFSIIFSTTLRKVLKLA